MILSDFAQLGITVEPQTQSQTLALQEPTCHLKEPLSLEIVLLAILDIIAPLPVLRLTLLGAPQVTSVQEVLLEKPPAPLVAIV